MEKRAIVCGAGGFIGGHMVKRLLEEGYQVVGVDIKRKQDWYQLDERALNKGCFDLRNAEHCMSLLRSHPSELYQLAADMGGAGYIFTGEHDADVMHNSASINLNIANAVKENAPKCKVFYSSSACIYPGENQTDPENPNCKEDSAYPANPDSEYGWEKLFSERLWKSYSRNYGIQVRIARFHNIFGPYGTWTGGKEKAPAAMSRKAILAGESMEVWGPGTQTRSFLYVDECVEAVRRLMQADTESIINIGSDEMISINGLARMALSIVDKDSTCIENIEGPVGVMGRCSDNTLMEQVLGWKPSMTLVEGMKFTLDWIREEMVTKV